MDLGGATAGADWNGSKSSGKGVQGKARQSKALDQTTATRSKHLTELSPGVLVAPAIAIESAWHQTGVAAALAQPSLLGPRAAWVQQIGDSWAY